MELFYAKTCQILFKNIRCVVNIGLYHRFIFTNWHVFNQINVSISKLAAVTQTCHKSTDISSQSYNVTEFDIQRRGMVLKVKSRQNLTFT